MKTNKLNQLNQYILERMPFIEVVLKFILVLLMIHGVYLFMAGFHNVDTCHNEKILEQNFNIYLRMIGDSGVWDISEIRSDGVEWSLSDCYRTGLNQMIQAFFGTLVMSIAFGMLLTLTLTRNGKNG